MMSSKYETAKHGAKTKAKPTHKRLLKIPLNFDEAIKNAIKVKPPPEGWAEYERRANHERKRRGSKSRA